MGCSATPAARGGTTNPGESHGLAHTLGWRCFLAFVALTPLIVGALPPQAGSFASFLANDPVSLPKVVAFLALSGFSLAMLCVSVVLGEAQVRWHPLLWLLVALVGWAGVSTLFSTSPALSVWGAYLRNEGLVAIFGYGLVVFLAIQFVRSTRDLRTVMVVAVVSGCLVSAYALLQSWGFDPIQWSDAAGRVWSTFGNADMLGNYLVFPLALALGLALSSARTRLRFVWWSAVALIAVALWLTETRGAWIAASASVLCMAWVGWQQARRASRGRRIAFGAVALALVTGTVAAIAFVQRGRLAGSSALPSVLARASNGRTVIWLTGLRGWLAHPITGWGPDGFGRAFESAVGADWYSLVAAGFGSADNAHNFLVQALVTLGIPGLVLTVWALGYAVIQGFRGLPSAKGASRVLLLACWAALIGLIVALTLGVSTPEVSVWLWLTVGLLLAPVSNRVPVPPRAVLVTAIALALGATLWAASWLVADVIVGHAMQLEPGAAQVSALESAVQLNPLSQQYRGLAADALVNEALAEQRAGQGAQTVDATILKAIAAYYAAAQADRGDILVRIALADVLVRFAATHPGSDAAQQAVSVAQDAVGLAPQNAAALVMLARAYETAGRRSEAAATARLARSVAPAYSAQALGSLGL